MKLRAEFDLTSLSSEEMARFEVRCQTQGITPEQKLAQLIKAAIGQPKPSPAIKRAKKSGRALA